MALTAFLVWFACDRFWHALAIAALAAAFFPVLAATLTGDVSRLLPAGTFASGIDGKDQVVVASAVATVLFTVMLAACLFGAAKAAWRRFMARH